MSQETTAVLVGAGQRGHHVYGRWASANPERLRFVAVADPDPGRRERFAAAHGLGPGDVHESASDLFARGRIADACIIASPDRDHHGPAVAAMDAGYHVLLEKPMASTLEDVMDLVRRTRTARGVLQVAHVLRYTPFFRALHRIVTSGRLGDVVTVEHRENVWAFHMAHSYVRGNWATTERAAPMVVTKTCHDFDILTWNLASRVSRIASVGSLFEFRPERAPAGATARCTHPCPVRDCPYDARRVYLDPEVTGWPVHVITDDLSPEGRLHALRSGPYGRCVYTAGSDVVDHQICLMELENGASVALHLHGHAAREERTIRYDGTRATLKGVFGRSKEIIVADHAGGPAERVPIAAAGGGHGGGDAGILESFLAAVAGGAEDTTDAASSLESHLLAFTAEEARLCGAWLDLGTRRREPV